MSKHTPGPWGFRGLSKDRLMVSNHADSLAIRLEASQSPEADARLIAAAPELLEALERLLEHTESCQCSIVNGDQCHHHDGTRFTSGADSALPKILGAIAKAEGRE